MSYYITPMLTLCPRSRSKRLLTTSLYQSQGTESHGNWTNHQKGLKAKDVRISKNKKIKLCIFLKEKIKLKLCIKQLRLYPTNKKKAIKDATLNFSLWNESLLIPWVSLKSFTIFLYTFPFLTSKRNLFSRWLTLQYIFVSLCIWIFELLLFFAVTITIPSFDVPL